ncbi:serine/threonine-protein kinase [Pendulispora albinea]|uniref:Serine/threonine protein kinase n=1 Tax=Pendulispora albinea TaxID=2741071 RepID=A0ABZ2LNA9_9BACT
MRPVPNESKIPAGTLLVGKYRVTREIGRGGMAAVYEAEQTTLNKKVAVKVLAAELSASSIVIERFFREARAAASVRSPYIVDVYDSGRLEDGRPFICMELLEGESLYDRMARLRLIDPETTVRIITQCAKGLSKAHAAGIVHRDLKPENIFLIKTEEGGEISKLLDFGLAKFYAPVAPDVKTARLTREGAVFGTPAYMSPEQVKGQGSVDHRADLWALGCMAFECLIGRPVWNTEQGVAMTFAAIATAPIPVPSKLRPDLPATFDAWFFKALERDPDHRFQDAKELSEALVQAFERQAVPAVAVAAAAARASRASLSERHDPEGLETTVVRHAAHSAEENMMGGGAVVRAAYAGAGAGVALSLTPPVAGAADPGVAAEFFNDANGRRPGLAVSPRPGMFASGAESLGASVPEISPGRTPSAGSASQVLPAPPPSAFRWVFSSAALVGGSVAAFVVWTNMLKPQVFNPTVASTATMAPIAGPSGSPSNVPPVDEPKWMTAFADGQKLFAAGDIPGALRRLKDAQELGGNTPGGGAALAARGLADQIRAVPVSRNLCKPVAFSHPRFGPLSNIGRPAIASVEKGTLVAWTDDHEEAGHYHVYSVVLDDVGRPQSASRDLTPEASEVMRPGLLTVNDRAVLYYWDKTGGDAGVRVRWIDPNGRIGGASTLVGAERAGNFYPALDRAPDGFYVAWQDDRDKEGDDLFLRKLSNDLEPQGNEVRLTDYLSVGGRNASARYPGLAIASNAVFVVYKLEREPQHTIARMRLKLGTAELKKGLDERTTPGPKGGGLDRELGDVAIVNEDKLPGDQPVIACGAEGCFIAWHGEKGGAYAAMVEPAGGRVLWRKKLGDKSSHPSLGVGTDGVVQLAYYDAGRIKMAPLTRDGVGVASVIGKVLGDQPRPAIAPGRAKGEWSLAWQDFEAGHTEAYAARVVCRP